MHYAPAVVDPPPGADVIDDWKLYYRLAQRLGLGLEIINVCGTPDDVEIPPTRHRLDMTNEPSTDDIVDVLSEGSAVTRAEVRWHEHGPRLRRGA